MPEPVAKRCIEDLACFGGPPLFARPLPIGQLAMPDEDAFFGYARQTFSNRRLTNNGPLVQELELRLAALHQVDHCIAFANASLAIILLIHLLAAGRRGEVIMPAFTYAGLPHLARWAGQTPRFCDIEADSHTLDPAAVAAAITDDTTAILGVHQVNSPCRILDLSAIAEQRGIPLIFDAVHGVACTFGGQPIGRFGRAEVFSLHATKLLNGFEGGYATTNDRRLAEDLRCSRNFGFIGESEVSALGMNAKLNELHAACALAGLDRLDDCIARNRARVVAYQEAFAGIPGLGWLPYGEATGDVAERHNYEFALLQVPADWPLTRNQVVTLMRAEGALARAYYDPPLHHSPHCPEGIAVPDLPVTERLAQAFVQMPVGELVTTAEVVQLAVLFRFLHSHGEQIAQRLGVAEGRP
ncbi:MAG: aminotransferase class I/II-fold pyridoxal phosphate-dependent enzyme [Rhodocyclales bacterium]|nr:aminotransferase class I/II-fold pyridoxal phosphate-dependent enzyme [Rhodocyclales bacterium]